MVASMPIAREKSGQPDAGTAVSTEQVAEQFCAKMIQNLKRDVQETKPGWTRFSTEF
jgi:hypothetical protein